MMNKLNVSSEFCDQILKGLFKRGSWKEHAFVVRNEKGIHY